MFAALARREVNAWNLTNTAWAFVTADQANAPLFAALAKAVQ